LPQSRAGSPWVEGGASDAMPLSRLDL